MNSFQFRSAIVCQIMFLLLGVSLVAEKNNRPNFVFIFADDMGYRDLACYGHPYAKTPNIDKLASQGTRFIQAYAAGPTCNPSRTGIMTGISNARFEKRTDDFDFGNKTTVTEILNKNGYATGHFGKWHIGMDRSDGIYGIDENESGGKPIRDSAEGRDTPIFDEAIKFIRKHKNKPFYVNIWGFTTHSPVVSASNFLDEFKNVKVNRQDFSPYMDQVFNDSHELGGDVDLAMRHYLGNVYAFDQNVKSVMDVLDQLDLSENTVVVFSSDQGPQRPYGIGHPATGPEARDKIKKNRSGSIMKSDEHAKNMLGDAGLFRGNKGTVREGGLRVPFIIRWPGKISSGKVDDQNIICGLDWLPSICRLAGIRNMPNIDGEDVSSVWLGEDTQRAKPIYWNSTNPGPALREDEWKFYLIQNKKKDFVGIELYNVINDPSESQEISEKYPEKSQELKNKLLAWYASLPKNVAKTGKYRHKY